MKTLFVFNSPEKLIPSIYETSLRPSPLKSYNIIQGFQLPGIVPFTLLLEFIVKLNLVLSKENEPSLF